MSEERFNQLETRFDGVDARLDGMDARLDGMDARLDGVDARLDGVESRLGGVESRLDGVESRLGSVEVKLDGVASKLDGVVADAVVLKNGQASMEERLTSKMLMLHEDTIARLRTISEAQSVVPEATRTRDAALMTDVTRLFDADRHFSRVLDEHEHRITALEKPHSGRA